MRLRRRYQVIRKEVCSIEDGNTELRGSRSLLVRGDGRWGGEEENQIANKIYIGKHPQRPRKVSATQLLTNFNPTHAMESPKLACPKPTKCNAMGPPKQASPTSALIPCTYMHEFIHCPCSEDNRITRMNSAFCNNSTIISRSFKFMMLAFTAAIEEGLLVLHW